jgi:hypothetical protein
VISADSTVVMRVVVCVQLAKTFDLKAEMHKYGINLRFLGHVYAGLMDVPILNDLLLIELVARYATAAPLTLLSCICLFCCVLLLVV